MTTQTSINGSVPSHDRISNRQLWVGWIMTAIASLFLMVDGVMKLFKSDIVVRATSQLGYRESAILGIGGTLLICTLLYVVPRTSTLGVVLLTGYLGGAVASNVRAGMPIFNIMFPIIIASLAWGGLWFRDIRIRNILP